MEQWMATLSGAGAIRALAILFGGWIVAKLATKLIERSTRRYTDAQGAMILRRFVYWLVLVVALIMSLRQLGFELSVLLGAAGIFTVAFGFASQTSASNIISGLFLIGERPFGVGDVIKVGSTLGEVLSIDLLSVKLRTFDNLLVRIPNESLIKSEITNLSRFPIRRADLMVGVAYKEDIDNVKKVLMATAEKNPLCLAEPNPLFIFVGYGSSGIDLQFSVWAKRENFLDMKNSLQIEIKKAFEENDIEIPYPHQVLVGGHEPLRVMMNERE